jgi:ketol-acid reductoisomerase
MTARRRQTAEHEIEKTGAKLRGMMPWITSSKIIDKEKN